MPIANVLSWLDTHSGAVTAVATVVLVLITAAYVLVTYWLVTEQRRQGPGPEVMFELIGKEMPNADLRFRNYGTGVASELAVLAGPEEGVSATIPELGTWTSLLPGEEFEFRIRPPRGESAFADGELSLTLFYHDHLYAYGEVLLLSFSTDDTRHWVENRGSRREVWDARDLRAGARRTVGWHRKVPLWLRLGSLTMLDLLQEQEVLEGIRADLGKALALLRAQDSAPRSALWPRA
ncbi:MAG TPA: hypothetical protein VGK43_00720 [Solirubrobacterales bacterium]